MVAVIILLRNLTRIFYSGGNRLSIVRCLIILRSGVGLTYFDKNNCTNFSGGKKYKEAFRGVHF